VRFLLNTISHLDLRNGLAVSPQSLKFCNLCPNFDAFLYHLLPGKELGKDVGWWLGSSTAAGAIMRVWGQLFPLHYRYRAGPSGYCGLLTVLLPCDRDAVRGDDDFSVNV
jgi:hypothetical protein